MACPYFFPTERVEAELWPHRPRLPLADGWRGRCTASGGETSEDEVKTCNLGYAAECPHLPKSRAADAVRFGGRRSEGRMSVQWITERAHRPVGQGILQFDLRSGQWLTVHENPCIQRMAECYLQARCGASNRDK